MVSQVLGWGCPLGYYRTWTSDSPCKLCDSSCTTGSCQGPLNTDCLPCTPNQVYFAKRSKCISQCPDGSYSDTRICVNCHPSCATCSGPNETSCKTCPRSNPLFNTQNNSCVSSCPSNTYYVPGNFCLPCDPSCSTTCNGPLSTNCLP
jgi:proprotein convertase subtilisin/kexin type 5